MRKKLIAVLLVLVCCFVGAGAIDVTIDGEPLATTAEPVIQNNHTMVPLRDIFEAMGATVTWDATTQTASAQKGDRTVVIGIGQPQATVNGTAVSLETPATILNRHTMVPLRFIAESFQARTLWDNTSKSVHILTADHKNLVVDYIDLNGYDCTLLSCGGEFMLINVGNITASDTLIPYLQKAGARQLRYVVATYPDLDHVGDMPAILEQFPTATVLLAEPNENTSNYDRLLEKAQSKEIPVSFAQEGNTYALGGATVRVVAAEKSPYYKSASLVLQADYGDTTFLLMGGYGEPAGQALLERSAQLPCDVLKVNNYSTFSPVHDDFRKMAAPTTAIISCGEDKWSFSDPNQSASDKQSDIPVWRTGLDGDIIALSNGKTCTVVDAAGKVVVPAKPTLTPVVPPTDSTPVVPPTDPTPNPIPVVPTPEPTPDPIPVVPTPDPIPDPIPVVPTPATDPTPVPDPTPSQGDRVYITKSGKRYHYDPHCNGGTYFETTLSEALSKGLTPCKKCAQ